MKKIQILLFTGIIISLITTKATAQLAVNTISKNHPNIFAAGVKEHATPSKSEAKLLKATSRALNDFTKAFKNKPEAKWSTQSDVIIATFEKNDIKTKVVYNTKGSWLYTLQTYKENKMPKDIREAIKRSMFFDYDIELVHEINEQGTTAYLVDLKNGKEFKQISFYDGEINVLQEFVMQ
jgi:hypothetical protein